MACETSTVVINGTNLGLDPSTYQPYGGKRRGSTHDMLDGTVVFQDFGFSPTNRRITFSGQLVDPAVITALRALYDSGGTFPFVGFGETLTCRFIPGDESLTFEAIRGSANGWQYSIKLAVIG